MQHIRIKDTFRVLLAGLALLAGASAAQAAQIDGSIALSVNGTTANTGDVTTASSFTFTTLDTDTPSRRRLRLRRRRACSSTPAPRP